MGRAIVNLQGSTLGRGLPTRPIAPYRSGYRIRPWARPIIITGVPAFREVGNKCVDYFRDGRGRLWRYEGEINSQGKCVWYQRRLEPLAFNGERQVWSDMTGRYC